MGTRVIRIIRFPKGLFIPAAINFIPLHRSSSLAVIYLSNGSSVARRWPH